MSYTIPPEVDKNITEMLYRTAAKIERFEKETLKTKGTIMTDQKEVIISLNDVKINLNEVVIKKREICCQNAYLEGYASGIRWARDTMDKAFDDKRLGIDSTKHTGQAGK